MDLCKRSSDVKRRIAWFRRVAARFQPLLLVGSYGARRGSTGTPACGGYRHARSAGFVRTRGRRGSGIGDRRSGCGVLVGVIDRARGAGQAGAAGRSPDADEDHAAGDRGVLGAGQPTAVGPHDRRRCELSRRRRLHRTRKGDGYPVDILRQRGIPILGGASAGHATAGGQRANSDCQPHMGPPGHPHDHGCGNRRPAGPQQHVPGRSLRGGHEAVFSAAVHGPHGGYRRHLRQRGLFGDHVVDWFIW